MIILFCDMIAQRANMIIDKTATAYEAKLANSFPRVQCLQLNAALQSVLSVGYRRYLRLWHCTSLTPGAADVPRLHKSLQKLFVVK